MSRHIEGRIKHLIGDEDGSYPGETLAHRNRLERDNHLGYLFQATNEAKKHNQNTEKHRKGIR